MGSKVGVCVLIAVALLVAAPASYATFPGANGKIAFTHEVTGDLPLRVNTIDPDGSTQADLGQGTDATWSPDGTEIAFQHNGDVWIMDADGTGKRNLTGSFQPPNFEGLPTWSPDGDEIVYVAFGANFQLDLFRMSADGVPHGKVTADASQDVYPDWSPDGTKIVFVRGFTLHTVNPDGTGLTSLGIDATQPSWSPDSSKLAFTRDDGIYVSDADGTNMAPVFTDVRFAAGGPAWSPDGTRIALDRLVLGHSDIYSIDADGGDLQQLTADDRPDEGPDWQPLPACTAAAASPSTLTSPNHKFEPVTVTAEAGSAVTITGVTQDEPVTASGADTTPDAQATLQPDRISLRSERNPHGDGRVYRIAFTAVRANGGACADTVSVSVPRRPNLAAVDSAPPSFDSSGG